MNELEKALREQLHGAADRLNLTLDEGAVLAEARRARTARMVRWAVMGLAVLAVAAAALYALWVLGGGQDDRRAVPNPLTTPSVEPTPTASPSASPAASPTASPSVAPSAAPSSAPSGAPSAAPSAAPTEAPRPGGGAAVLIDLNYRDGTGKVNVQADGNGLRFTGLDAGATGSATLAAPTGNTVTVRSGVPGPSWVVGVLPARAAWATVIEESTGSSFESTTTRVPGTDLLAFATTQDEPAASPKVLWGTADGQVFTGDGRALPAATFPTVWGGNATHFVDDTWVLSGYALPRDGGLGATVGRLDTDLLAVTTIGGPDADTVEFVLSLPAGADPNSVEWDFGQDARTVIPQATHTLPDGRILVHQAFSAPGLGDQLSRATASYIARDGNRYGAPLAR